MMLQLKARDVYLIFRYFRGRLLEGEHLKAGGVYWIFVLFLPRQSIYIFIYKDISVKIIDRLTGGNRMRESFWQYRLDCFAPKGLNTRQVDT